MLSCRICESTHPLAPLSSCPACSGPLDVRYVWDGDPQTLLPHAVAEPASPTPLVPAPRLSAVLEIDLYLKLETASATHSFKDRMAASAVAAAQAFGIQTLFCASTGNLGEAVAARCAATGLEAVILGPADTHGRPTPAATYGASVFAVRGSVEDCRRLERDLEHLFPWGFLEGNLRAFAVEGAKTVAYEIAGQLGGVAPDAIVSPVGSGTLLAKLAQGFVELAALGLVTGPTPRLHGAQPGGCPPVAAAWADERPPSRVTPETLARSLAVGDPAYGELAIGAARMSGGSVTTVPEDQILSSTELLAENTGVLADPAAGVAFGSLLELVRVGAIEPGERVVLVVTGSGMKPPRDEAQYIPREIDADAEDFLGVLGLRRD